MGWLRAARDSLRLTAAISGAIGSFILFCWGAARLIENGSFWVLPAFATLLFFVAMTIVFKYDQDAQ